MKGITVTLYEKQSVGKDEFNHEIFEEYPVDVKNVLIAPASATEVLDTTTMEGKRAVYVLGIPKGDTHFWEDSRIDFFGQKWKSFGIPERGIDELIPLAWNMKVMVERYE